MRLNPLGSTCRKKRWMNVSAVRCIPHPEADDFTLHAENPLV
jgi:hypothetical protein